MSSLTETNVFGISSVDQLLITEYESSREELKSNRIKLISSQFEEFNFNSHLRSYIHVFKKELTRIEFSSKNCPRLSCLERGNAFSALLDALDELVTEGLDAGLEFVVVLRIPLGTVLAWHSILSGESKV